MMVTRNFYAHTCEPHSTSGSTEGGDDGGWDNPDISVKEILTLTAANPRWRVTFRRLSIVSILEGKLRFGRMHLG
jgi:hypothetical protein